MRQHELNDSMSELGAGQRCASEHELNDAVSELGSGSEPAHVTAGRESSLFLHATADERSGVHGSLGVPESGPDCGVLSGRAITVSQLAEIGSACDSR